MSWSERLTILVDRLHAIVIGAILVGSTLAFGGLVWWFRPALFAGTGLLLISGVLRMALSGRVRVWKSPLSALGVMCLALAVVQLVPLPGGLVRRISPHAAQMRQAASSDGSPDERATLSMDRSATLRWLGGACAGLIVFCASGRFVDRVGRLRWVWASVLLGFGLCTMLGLVQLVGGLSGLYGGIEPGQGPVWAPSLADAQRAPGATLLRRTSGAGGGWAAARPQRVFSVGTMMGGPGAYLALASLALPLALGLVLRDLSPRGSRESLATRLRDEGGAARLAVLLGVVLIGSALVGIFSGPVLAAPIALGMTLAGLSGLRVRGVRAISAAVTLLTLSVLGTGLLVGPRLERVAGREPIAVGGLSAAEPCWREALRVARDFPVLGAGLGSYPTLVPYYKSTDETPTTARSSVAQWGAETGLAGLALLAVAVLWSLWRLPGCLRRVEAADWVLPASLAGALSSFLLFSSVHWSVELSAVALAACSVAGTANRWLSGGTDLFLERA